METGEVAIFVTSSIGGKIATEELTRAYARRLKRMKSRANPIIQLASKDTVKDRPGTLTPARCRLLFQHT